MVLLAPVQTPPHGVRDDDEEDLNKAFEVQGFHQILSPPANCPPDSHRVYDEQDFEGEIAGEWRDKSCGRIRLMRGFTGFSAPLIRNH